MNLANTDTGGRTWNLISTASTNPEGAGKLLLRDANAAAVRATFDNNGNVGIGMSTFPNMGGTLLSVTSSALDNGGISVGGNGTSEVLYLYANTSTNYAGIQVKRPFIQVDHLILQEQGGSVGIGITNPADRLHVAGDIRVGSGSTGCVKDADGTVIAGACSSDARFKRDVTPFPKILDRLVRLQPVHFYWRTTEYPEKAFGESRSFGLVAQDVEQVLPELVTEDEKGFKAIRYNKLPLLILQGLKDLKADNDSLRRENGTLKQRLEEQEARLRRLEAKLGR